MAGDEGRKAKLLFIRNELAEYEESLASAHAFGLFQLIFLVIPVFWPVLLAQRYMMIAGCRSEYRQLRNALDVWGGDLGSDAEPLAAELERLHARTPRLLWVVG
jgi:hypothetical protein